MTLGQTLTGTSLRQQVGITAFDAVCCHVAWYIQ